jgi:hypothetical protein
MAEFSMGLFGNSGVSNSRSNAGNVNSGLQFAAQAINKATTKTDGNAFDTFTLPMRQRKRRDAAKEASEKGLRADQPEFYQFMTDKLTQFGDMEGAEIAANKGLEIQKGKADIRKTEAGASVGEAQAAAIPIETQLQQDKFDFSKEIDTANLRLKRDELKVMQQRATNDTERVAIANKIAEADVRLKAAQEGRVYADTELTDEQARDIRMFRDERLNDLRSNIAARDAGAALDITRNEILSATGLPEAEQRVQKLQQEVEQIRVQSNALENKDQREDAFAQVKKRLLTAQAELAEAKGATEVVTAEVLAATGGGSATKSRKITATDIKNVKKEIEPILKDLDLEDGAGPISISVAHKLEAMRVMMGDRAFQAMATQKDGRVNLLRSVVEQVVEGNTTSTFGIDRFKPPTGAVQPEANIGGGPVGEDPELEELLNQL